MRSVETVTMLFTDLVGSTGMASRIGPAAAEDIRQEHFGLLREAIGETGGDEIKTLGDGIMAAFGSVSHALDCATGMQRRIALRNRRADEVLSLRIGVALGEASREGHDYFGPPVVEAARLCAAADGDQVLVASLAQTMVRGRGHEFEPVGELELKGMPEPVAAFELRWESEQGNGAGGIPLPARLRGVPPIGFVGRKEEQSRLDQIAAATRAGRRQVALISGEPGIGKTRLASHAALERHANGAAVLFGCSIEGLEAPYGAWSQVLSHYVEHGPREVIERHVDRHGGELQRLAPGLSTRVPDLPEPKLTDPETERYLLRAAAVGLLEEAARERELVIVLDDLQWADTQTLGMLGHLVASISDAELLVLGTYRDSELAQGDRLTQLLGDLRREQGVERIDLGGLGRDDVGSMMEAAAGHELNEEGVRLSDEIIRETDGNPFFVAEMLRHLDESGAVAPDDAGRWTLTGSLAELGLPQSIREVVTSRAGRLGEETVSLLATAAVIGREFDLELLARAVDRDEEEVLDLLDGAVEVALLHEGRSAGRFSFAHTLVNHTLYEGLGATRRARTHRRIAEALEEICGDEPGDRVGELALHWLRATAPQEPLKASRYSIRAGTRALAELAPEEALSWFQRATELLEQTSGVDATLCDALIGLGDAQRQVGDDSFRETLLEASELAKRLADGVRMAKAAQANTRGFASVVGQVDEQRVAALEEALELCDEDEQRASLLSLLARELSYSADLARRFALSDEALRLAKKSGDAQTLAWALARRQIAIAAPETLTVRLAEAEELIALADELDDPMLRYWARVWRAMDALEAGDLETAGRCRAVHEEIAVATGQPLFRWVNTFAPVVLACLAGDFDRAEELAARSAAIGSEAGQPDVAAISAAQIHAIRYEQGRCSEIVGLVEEAVERTPLLDAAYSSVLAHTYCEVDEGEKARAILNRFAADRFEMTPTLASNPTLCLLTEVASRLNEREAARLLYERLLVSQDQLSYSGVTIWGPVARFLGLAAACLGRHDDADRQFSHSAATCERIAAPTWLARTRHEWALMLRDRNGPGDAKRAEALLELALQAAVAHGCASLERRVRAAIARPTATARST